MKLITIHNPSNIDTGQISTTVAGDSYRSLEEREEVQLVDPSGQAISYAEVINVWSGPLTHVPALLLEMSNDPLQRTFSGVHMHLLARRGADEAPIQHDDIVSILVLRPKTSTLIRPTMNDIKAAR